MVILQPASPKLSKDSESKDKKYSSVKIRCKNQVESLESECDTQDNLHPNTLDRRSLGSKHDQSSVISRFGHEKADEINPVSQNSISQRGSVGKKTSNLK